jgi:hypothetical protein
MRVASCKNQSLFVHRLKIYCWTNNDRLILRSPFSLIEHKLEFNVSANTHRRSILNGGVKTLAPVRLQIMGRRPFLSLFS